jgi:L-arginine dehydrogenase
MTNEFVRLDAIQVAKRLAYINVPATLRRMFQALAQGEAAQPPQLLNPFPNGRGDFISYLGILPPERVFGVKLSPYLKQPQGAVVTAWTLLMSMDDGRPRLLCDSGQLTVERTAGTTALAVDFLAPAGAGILAVIGTGPLGQAHIRHALPLRPWRDVRLYSQNIATLPESRQQALRSPDPRISLHASLAAAVADADVILLCTSSGQAVLDPAMLNKKALITSISTNAALAHEVPPAALPQMDVYCDYRATTPDSAGDMRLARERHGWQPSSIRGDLPELAAGTAALADYNRHVFFRSIGLGLEDVALASALYRQYAATS